ncbi:hypothetical protein KSP39_PZI018491 [Platanthera zijinensis]|uniref:Uncharacterized protein n=1 Tax=Platanthera zijinensis TaxID=2320716 RepID=A0AAP0FYN4_9ASPA
MKIPSRNGLLGAELSERKIFEINYLENGASEFDSDFAVGFVASSFAYAANFVGFGARRRKAPKFIACMNYFISLTILNDSHGAQSMQ